MSARKLFSGMGWAHDGQNKEYCVGTGDACFPAVADLVLDNGFLAMAGWGVRAGGVAGAGGGSCDAGGGAI